MSIDVSKEIMIRRARPEVAGFVMSADNDPVWMGAVVDARVLTEEPPGRGMRVARVIMFLGKRIEYVSEVVEHQPDALMVMRTITSEAPFAMTVTYRFEDEDGATRMRIRVQGDMNGSCTLTAPRLARAVERSIQSDLETLRDLIESATGVV